MDNSFIFFGMITDPTKTVGQIAASKFSERWEPRIRRDWSTPNPVLSTAPVELPWWNGPWPYGGVLQCIFMQFLVFSVFFHTLRQLLVPNSSLFLKIISPSGIAIVNYTGTAPGHVGQCFNALAFCIFSCSYSKKWYF